MTAPVLSKTLAAGNTIVAADLMTLFEDLVDACENVTGARLSDDAGISSRQLSDRYSLSNAWMMLVPITSGANLASPADFTLDGEVTIFKHKWLGASGREDFLAEVALYVASVGSPNPTFAIYKNSVVMGGGAITLDTSDAFYRLGYASPLSSALATLSDGDLIEMKLNVASAGTGEIRGLFVRLSTKSEVRS